MAREPAIANTASGTGQDGSAEARSHLPASRSGGAQNTGVNLPACRRTWIARAYAQPTASCGLRLVRVRRGASSSPCGRAAGAWRSDDACHTEAYSGGGGFGSGQAGSQERLPLDILLEGAVSGASGSQDVTAGSHRRNAAARRALRQSLIDNPWAISKVIKGLA